MFKYQYTYMRSEFNAPSQRTINIWFGNIHNGQNCHTGTKDGSGSRHSGTSLKEKIRNTGAKFACVSGYNTAKPPVFCNDAGRTNI